MRRLQRRFGLPVAPTEPIRITPGALSLESHGDASPSTSTSTIWWAAMSSPASTIPT